MYAYGSRYHSVTWSISHTSMCHMYFMWFILVCGTLHVTGTWRQVMWHTRSSISHTSMCHMKYLDTSDIKSCDTYAWVMSHTWMRHGPHLNESWRFHEWVMSHMSHIRMSHASRLSDSYHTHISVAPANSNKSCHMSHVSHMNDMMWHESCHTHECHAFEWVIPHTHRSSPRQP